MWELRVPGYPFKYSAGYRFFYLVVECFAFFMHAISLDNVSCRLYTEEYYLNEMPSEGIPEMQRSNLVSCIIQVR
jgi:hypothetical protein